MICKGASGVFSYIRAANAAGGCGNGRFFYCKAVKEGRMSEKTDIKSMNLETLTKFLTDMGEKKFRAKQIYEWLHLRQVESFEEMTNLSKTLREQLDKK